MILTVNQRRQRWAILGWALIMQQLLWIKDLVMSFPGFWYLVNTTKKSLEGFTLVYETMARLRRTPIPLSWSDDPSRPSRACEAFAIDSHLDFVVGFIVGKNRTFKHQVLFWDHGPKCTKHWAHNHRKVAGLDLLRSRLSGKIPSVYVSRRKSSSMDW